MTHRILLALAAFAVAQAAAAADPPARERVDRILQGDAVCTRCHDEQERAPPVFNIARTAHGTRADARTPTCVSCHGESPTHVNRPRGLEERPPPDRTFKKGTTTPVAERNQACLTCHKGGNATHWAGSAHENADLACSSCHQVHAPHDRVLQKATQFEVCIDCHKERRAQLDKNSRHPIKEGKVACSDCHNPHGSAGDNLLKTRPPFLCQQCHEPTSHRGAIPGLTPGTGIAGANVTQARQCLNCHTNIHGTNNPVNVGNQRTFRR